MHRTPRKSSFGIGGHDSLLREILQNLQNRPRLLLAVDAVIAFLLLVFPFVMGGREAWGHWLLISSACLLGALWCLHRFRESGRLRWLGLEPLLVAALLLVWFQTQPLSDAALLRISSEYQRLIPAWSTLHSTTAAASNVKESAEADGLVPTAGWPTISFLPVETRHALLVLVAYGLIAVVFAQRLSTAADCCRILRLTAISGVMMSAFAVLQLLTSNDCFFWFYQHPWTGTREVLKGAFTNRNHFAQFLALSLGPLIWWSLAGGERPAIAPVNNRRKLSPAQGNHSQMDTIVDARQLMLLAGASGVLIAVLLSLSRGGVVAAGTACCVVFAGLWRSGRVGSSMALSIILIGSLAVAGIAMFGGQKVENRVAQLATLDASQIDESNARRSIWRADIEAFKRFPLLGTGVGSHRYVYPAYMEDLADYSSHTFSHAESSWVHLALETGWAGLILLTLGLGVIALRIVLAFVRRADSGRLAPLAACAAALAGGLVHSLADFIWYVPAIVVTTLALAVAALRLCSIDSGDSGLPLPRPAWLGMAAACLFLLVSVQSNLQQRITGERWWYRYLVSAFESRRNAAERGEAAEEPTPLGESDDQAKTSDAEIAEDADAPYTERVMPEGTAAYGVAEDSEHSIRQQRIQELRSQLALLLKSWKARPHQPDVALHIARRSLELFELQQSESDNPLPLVQIRDAVLSSDFVTRDAMLEFLNRAFGSTIRLPILADTMSRSALLQCPLLTEGWKNLITTGFLRDPQDELHLRTIAQTLRLGRFDPAVRFSVGQSLFLTGRPDDAVVQWNAAFHANRDIRRRICSVLAPRFPAQTLLRNFSPSLLELEDVFLAYRKLQSQSDLRRLVEVIAEQSRNIPETRLEDMANHSAESSSEATDLAPFDTENGESFTAPAAGDAVEFGERNLPGFLMLAAVAAGELKLESIQETLLRRAATLAPEAESPRRALGLLLFEREEYRSADRLFEACAELNPGDTKLEELRRECRRLEQSKNRRLRTVSEQSGSIRKK
jgi:hypothetical protein